jgi:hypothetical protein
MAIEEAGWASPAASVVTRRAISAKINANPHNGDAAASG